MKLRALMIVAALAAAVPCRAQTGAPPDSAPPPPPMAPVTPTPPDFPRGRISGYMFGDLYDNLVGDPRHLADAKGVDQGQTNIDAKKAIGKDLNGVQLRRVYFQLDNDLTARISTRLRLELDGKELTSGGKLGVYAKNAYLLAKSVYPRGDLYFGEINTPTWETAEAFWQYRSIEKTMLDFLGLRSASDLGIGLKGYADPGHRFGYSAMMGDGNGQKPETDRFKVWYLALPVKVGDLRIEPYMDYQALRVNPNKTVVSDTLVNNDQATYKVFAGYEFRRAALGTEVFTRLNHGGRNPNVEMRGVSVFGRATPKPTLAAFARFDQLWSNLNTPNRVDLQLWIAGVDWQPIKDVHIMPNVEATQYLGRGTAVVPPHHDFQARVTFYYLFSRPQS